MGYYIIIDVKSNKAFDKEKGVSMKITVILISVRFKLIDFIKSLF